MSTATTVKISMALSLQHQYNTAQTTLNTKRQQLDQIEKNITFIQEKLAKGESVPRARLERVKPMIALQKQLSDEVEKTQAEYQSLAAMLQDYKEGAIQVSDVMYPGCKIVMGSIIKHVREDIKYAKIYIQDKDIKIDAFN